jgi:transglutaminase-like putative cysteine protease
VSARPVRPARSLTATGGVLVVAAAVLALLGALRQNPWLFVVALLSIATVLVSTAYLPRLDHGNLRLRRPRREVAGRDAEYAVSVEQARSGPAHRVSITPDGAEPVVVAVGASDAGTQDSTAVTVHNRARGSYEGVEIRVSALGPFGLSRSDRATRLSLPRLVLPRADPPVPPPDPTSDAAGDGDRRRIERSGVDVHGLRGWHPGDGSSVHWRSTVRRGTPIVVEREAPRIGCVVVLVAGRPGRPGFEALLSRICGIATRVAHDGGRLVLLAEGHLAVGGDLGTERAQQWCALIPPTLAAPSSATVAAAVAEAGSDGRLIVASTEPMPAAWLDSVRAGAGDVVIDQLVVDVDPPVEAAPQSPAAIAPNARMRLVAILSTALGMAALVLTGLATWAQAAFVVLGLGLAGASWLLLGDAALIRRARQGASVIAVALALVPLVSGLNADDLGLVLAPALGWLSVAHAFGQRTRRDVLVGLGLGPVLAVTAAGLAPGPGVLLPLLGAWGAMLVGRAEAVHDLTREGADATLNPRGLRRDRTLVPAVTLALASAVVAFLLLPLGAMPVADRSAGSGDGELGPAPLELNHGVLDLRARGPLPDTPVFRVREGGPTLWRASTLETLDGSYWTAGRLSNDQLTPDDSGVVRLPADPADSGTPAGDPRTYEVWTDGWTSAGLLTPGLASGVSSAASVYRYALDSYVVESLGEVPYLVTSTVRTDVDNLATTLRGPDRTEAVWTYVPATTTARTRNLARQITAGISDRAEQVRAVETWLRTHVGYQLDAPLPPQGQDAVDFLLFDSLTGFCQHFAAAEAVLLRSLGVPSRLATGYAITTGAVDGWSTARASDAHAWVEVWLPGRGWTTSDPTRGAQAVGAGSSWWDRALAAVTSWFSSDAARRLLAVVVAALAGAVLGVVLWLRRRSRSRTQPPETPRAQTEPLAALARLRDALTAQGSPLEPGDGLAEVRRRTARDPVVTSALDVAERCLYGGAGVPTAERMWASEVLDRHAAHLLAEAALTSA